MDKNIGQLRTSPSSLSASVASNAAKNIGREAGMRAMMFLLRVAFWLSVVVILLPSGSQAPASGSQVGAGEAMSAASAAVSDMRQFCGRQPEACTVGSQAAVVFGQKAQAGAKM